MNTHSYFRQQTEAIRKQKNNASTLLFSNSQHIDKKFPRGH